MADVVTGVEHAAAFCERCGAHGVEQAGDLETCRRCGLLACAGDRAAPGICRTCAEAARLSARRAGLQMARPVPSPSPARVEIGTTAPAPDPVADVTGRGTARRRLVVGTLSFAAIATVLAFYAAGSLKPAGSASTVDVAGAGAGSSGAAGADAVIAAPGRTPPMTASESPGTAPSTAPGGSTTTGLDVRATGVPTWHDVLGAWHGQALVAVRNGGPKEILVDAAGSRYAVVGPDGSTLAAGAFEAAVPPVLEPGATGYLVAGFTLVRAPGDGVKVRATPAATPAPDANVPVALRLSGTKIAFGADTVTATGSVSNPGATSVRDGAVAVILLDHGGRPLAAMLDLASAGRLAHGERATFRAAQPPVPPVERSSVASRVAVAWGVPAP